MNEAILLSVLWRDEAKTLGIVEPLNFSGGTHCGTSSSIVSEAPCCGTNPTSCVAITVIALRPDTKKGPVNTPGPVSGQFSRNELRLRGLM
jgi:hypothetical protein